MILDMESVEVFKQFSEDDVYQQFLENNFDVKSATSAAIQGVAITEHLSKLSQGIALLDKELHDQVSTHYEDLLSQATGIETLESVLHVVNSRIQTLLGTVERMQTKIAEPYEKAFNHTMMLARLQTTCDLLRRIIRIVHLSKRLQEQLQGGAKEITKAAQNLNELEYLTDGVDISEINVIKGELKFMKKSREQVEKQAHSMMEKGVETQNLSQVATALQVFHNLQILQPTIFQIVDSYRLQLHNTMKDSLNVKVLTQSSAKEGSARGTPGRAIMPVPGGTAAFRANLWINIENLMDKIYNACNKLQLLHKVLTKKRDPVSHICFIEELYKSGEADIMQNFWTVITKLLAEEFAKATNESGYIKQAFEGEYPKLLRLTNDLWKRLHQFNANISTTDSYIGIQDPYEFKSIFEDKQGNDDFDAEKALRDALQPFETAYVLRSLSRLYDSVNVAFAGGTKDTPTKEDVEAIVRTICSELNVSGSDAKLSGTIGDNVAGTAKLLVQKCENMICTDKDATQVSGPITASQKLNATVFQLLHLFYLKVFTYLSETTVVPEETIIIIKNSLEFVVSLMRTTIEPLTDSVQSAIKSIILTMHQEDFSRTSEDSNKSTSQSSLYMTELQNFIHRVKQDYFSQYPSCDILQLSLQELGCSTIEFFVCNASMVTSVGDKGKMQLAADCAQMEMAVAPLCERIGDLGKSYRMLRSFRPLLFQTAAHIVQSPAVGDIIPYSIVLHFLFSRGPKELKTPYELAGWTIREYSHWLVEHPSEQQRLVLIKGTLESYAKSVKQREEKEYCLVYPLMIELLQRSMKS